MNIGHLDKQVELQSSKLVIDKSTGGRVKQWSTYATVWAQFRPMTGTEEFFGGQLQGMVTHKIMLRYREELNVADRIKYDFRIFYIKSVQNVNEADKVMFVLAEEKQEAPRHA